MARLEQLQKMLTTDPEDPFLNFALAMEYVKVGRPDDALNQFNRVIELDRKYVPAYFQKANLLVSLGRHDEAKSVFSEALTVAEQAGDKHAAAEIREALALLG
ncbi:MAG TPA: tetratricopeptide repeat protein [Phycisphaerae bacterium]|nr:tetratricopeptide repeat protein [Phycisphaerae bacterium]HOJ75968.1 tetratricopeptide repeat protein [Phycisphaerae bacterium]HOM53356.1 tetratricopeptide repeat protein [Phycisphaerae bacterium]HON66672.1 tetratricopeptide repeat protein [Phycisphaerae bacterium]HOQ84443.1 tetratricopeptide repeat protein [Phycisphaerae bacterium]